MSVAAGVDDAVAVGGIGEGVLVDVSVEVAVGGIAVLVG